MAFDYANATIDEVTVEADGGPYATQSGRFIWVMATVHLGLPPSGAPVVDVKFRLAIDMSVDKKWSDIEAEARSAALVLLKHSALANALSVQSTP